MIIHDYLTDGRGLLKLPLGAFLVENLPVAKVAVNEFGTVRVEQGPGLASYRVSYGPDSPRDPPPQDQDLVAPLEELPALDQVFQELNLAVLPPKEQAQKVKDYLQGQFHYSLKLQPPASDSTALADFLLRTRTGHCEYFATAAVLLLRTCGVPARYATGYMVDEYSRLEGRYIVRARHAHAWALAWIDGRWVAPGRHPPGLAGPGNRIQSNLAAPCRMPGSGCASRYPNGAGLKPGITGPGTCPGSSSLWPCTCSGASAAAKPHSDPRTRTTKAPPAPANQGLIHLFTRLKTDSPWPGTPAPPTSP